MSSTFTPSDVIDMLDEKTWPSSLGLLDWDTTKIVFTKRSLIEFLKYTDVTVDTNFAAIAKLPRYAEFGKFAAASGAAAPQVADKSAVVEGNKSIGPQDSAAAETQESVYKPSRRVRDAPGGKDSIKSIFDSEEPEGREEYRPSRRVREPPGGKDSISQLW